MSDWYLVPCLDKLRSEFNVIAPIRDKSSDGSIGDENHQNSNSDHNPDETGNVPIRDVDRVNEVHALDVDVDLREPGLDMEKVVQFLLDRCRSGAEKRLRYIIFNRRIWSASNGWRQQRYTGKNPHDHHAHFSASYESKHEASTASWHLEDVMALSADDKTWLSAEVAKQVKACMDDFWAYNIGKAIGKEPYSAQGLQYDTGIRVDNMANVKLPAVGEDVKRLQTDLDALAVEVAEIKGIVSAPE